MSEKKWACILNPVAGGGYAKSHEDFIRQGLDTIHKGIEIHRTERPGHGTELAEQLLEQGYNRILVAGGDGTLHEVASALIQKPETAVGVISSGTGNDYNYTAGFPERFSASDWDALAQDCVKTVDVGLCNGQYFFNGMGLGFDAAMTAESHADRERTGKSGKARYSWIILKMLFGYKESPRLLHLDGEKRMGNSFLTTISIGRRFAAQYLLTPKALLNDGLLDLCDVDPIKIGKRLSTLLKVPKGTHIESSFVHYNRCKECHIEFETEVPAHLDGELIFSKIFDVSILPGALNLLVHPENHRPFFK